MIDVGGPAMLRAAAKNFVRDASFETGGLRRRAPRTAPRSEARRLSTRAGGWQASRSRRRPHTTPRLRGFSRTTSSRKRSRSPSTRPSISPTARTHISERRTTRSAAGAYTSCRASSSCAGMPLSFNNLNDLSAARLLAREFDEPACVIVKHANPCGVAVGETVQEAYTRALAADPVSAYGGVVVLNRVVGGTLGDDLAAQFVEVLFAPGYDEPALDALARKASVRILSETERRAPTEAELDYRRVQGGLLVQDGDRHRDARRHGGRLRRGLGGAVGRSPLRLARGEARDFERDRARAWRADDRNRSWADEPRGRGSDRPREGAGARSRAR